MKNCLLTLMLAFAATAHATSTYPLETLDLPDASLIRAIYHAKKPENEGLARAVSPMELYDYYKNEDPLLSTDSATIANIMQRLKTIQVIEKITYPSQETDRPELPTPCLVINSEILALEQHNGEWLFIANTCLQKGFFDTSSWQKRAVSKQLTSYHALEWQNVILSIQEKLRASP